MMNGVHCSSNLIIIIFISIHQNHFHSPNCPNTDPIPDALIITIIQVIIIFILYSSLFAQNDILFIWIDSGVICTNTLIGDVLMQIPSIPRGILLLIIRMKIKTVYVLLMETWQKNKCIKVYTNKNYSLIILIDSNKVILILSLFSGTLLSVSRTAYISLIPKNFFLSLSSRTTSPLGPTPLNGCCQLLFQLQNVLKVHILASVSSDFAISEQKTSIFMQWRSSSVHNLPTDDLWSSLLHDFTCWYCPYTFVIFAVTLFPRLAQSLCLLFFTCFQLCLAVPIPNFLIEPSKPVCQVPWFLVVSKYGAIDRQQQSCPSQLLTTLCHCSKCLFGS